MILVHKVTLETQESLDHRSVFNFNIVTNNVMILDAVLMKLQGPGGEPGSDGEPGARGQKGKQGASGADGHPGEDVSYYYQF